MLRGGAGWRGPLPLHRLPEPQTQTLTQVSCTTLQPPQIGSLSSWGFSRVGICLPSYCLPRQVLERNRCSVNNLGGFITQSHSSGVEACLPSKMQGLQGSRLGFDSAWPWPGSVILASANSAWCLSFLLCPLVPLEFGDS